MKFYCGNSIIWGLTMFFMLGCLNSCHNGKPTHSNATMDDESSIGKDNYVSDTIVGKFNGISVDTLVSMPLDTIPEKFDPDDIYAPWHYRWLAKSLRGTVKDLVIERTTRVAFVKEGDLDGDGGEEFGYVTQWPTSNWMVYHLFTYKNGDWKTLIEPTTIWLPHIDPEDSLYNPSKFTGKDIARPTGRKNEIHIRFSDVRNDGEDFLFIDTIVRVNPQPVKWDE